MAAVKTPECGLYPFWFWNGLENEAEIDRQIGLMRGQGVRGALIHSRKGNQVPYMSDRWLELVAAACESAKRRGLKIWIYDEDGYPSGNCGRKVQRTNPDLEQKGLSFEYAGSAPDADAFASFDAGTYEPVDEREIPAGTPVLRFRLRSHWFHVDTFNPESCRRFLEYTHERYLPAIGRYFGDVVEAFYTDDENYLTEEELPWSPFLEEHYGRLHGEALRALLPRLVEDLPGFGETRRRFYAAATDLFIRNFIDPQRKWAEAHGLAYLGHLCFDEGPLSCAFRGFGTPAPYFRAETVPSVDDFLCHLEDQRYLFHESNRFRMSGSRPGMDSRYPLCLYRHASSIAHQFGDDAFSAECLTLLGWGCTPQFMSRQMAFEIGEGVNLMTPHAFYYTIGDGARRDCPPSYFAHQPFFRLEGEMFRQWEESARLLRRGADHADAALLFPESFLDAMGGGEVEPRFASRAGRAGPCLDALEARFATTVLELERGHVGFDFLDEGLAGGAAVDASAGLLRVGGKGYRAVVLPDGAAPSARTRRLLDAFEAAGGRVVPAEDAPLLPPSAALAGEGAQEVLVHARDLGGGVREFYLANLGPRAARLSMAFPTALEVYDPLQRRVVHCGASLPEGFTLPRGAAVHLLSPGASGAPAVPFGQSAFAPLGVVGEARLVSARPLRDNVLALPRGSGVFTLCEGAEVRAVYGEHLGGGLTVDGVRLPLAAVAHHPCDPNFEGADAAGVFRPGAHAVADDAGRPMTYLSGRFRVAEGNRLVAPSAPGAGDLAAQGYPHYWGDFEYRFETAAAGAKRARLVFAGGGMAEVFVNGERVAAVADPASSFPLGGAFRPGGANELRVVFANIAENFVCGAATPFGVARVELLG